MECLDIVSLLEITPPLDRTESEFFSQEATLLVKYFEEGEFESLKDLLDRIQSTDITDDLMDYMNRLIHKKKLFDFNRDNFILEQEDVKGFFTKLELKLLSLITDTDYKTLVLDNRFKIEICRICCHHRKPNSMIDIFSCSTPGDLSFASKIGLCVDVPPIEEHDTLPKSICLECADNLRTCYEFQKLCRESDYDLRRDKTLRDMIMEQVLDGVDSTNSNWSAVSSPAEILEPEKCLHPPGVGIVSNDVTNRVSDLPNDISVATPGDSPLQTTKDDCDIRKFQCENCGSRFFDIYTLKTHWRNHKISKKYECPECGKKFRTNVMLKIHLR